jgi:hypothetical protein
VGEGGMNPEYFARALSLYEAKLFIAGLDRRYHAGWQQARFAGYWAAMPHLKNFDFEKMPKFLFEKEDEEADDRTEDQKAAELDALRAYALERDAKLLRKKEIK